MEIGHGNGAAPGGNAKNDIGSLVIGAADGDRQAWSQLVAHFAELVSSIASAHRLDEVDAARVRTTVWRRLDRNLGKIRQPDRVGTWLGAVARDECVKALSSSARRAA
jgi:DNA-directed RNA polymerase specialized sigma24 family protein